MRDSQGGQWAWASYGGSVYQAHRDVHVTHLPLPAPPGTDPASLAVRRRQADAMADSARVEEARAAYADMLDAHRQVLGPDHDDTLDVLGSLAWCNEALHAHVHALDQYVELHQRSTSRWGPRHKQTLWAQQGLMNTVGVTRGPAEACQIGADLLDGCRSTHGVAATPTLDAMRGYAWWLWSAGRATEARDLYADLYHALPTHHPARTAAEAEYHRWRAVVSYPRRMNRLPDPVRRYSRSAQQAYRDGYT
ncbi:tetratricopeptide repeat protein [Saccharothrix sp. NPDC042600]|uniref:tetratricopeptide repeat protein n=1 Tax=Saccharothrix TaxID=2071 RepID=UPI0033CA4693|nr:hypothetical protein GCM10017745_57090 [Saccharothrix mutabilis subsp. capreolus]